MAVGMLALRNPDPFDACHCGLTQHPRYHKCESCHRNRSCDIGALKMLRHDCDDLILSGIQSGLYDKNDYILTLDGHFTPNWENIQQKESKRLETLKEIRRQNGLKARAELNLKLRIDLQNAQSVFGKLWAYVKHFALRFHTYMTLEKEYLDQVNYKK